MNLGLALAITAGGAAFAQGVEPVSGDTADVRVVGYLSDRGLDEILAVYWRKKLNEGQGEQKAQAAEALGVLYARQLAAAADATTRKKVEERCKELLKLMPDTEAFELRINLAKTTYMRAEDIAERSRLRLATDEEKDEAVRILGEVGPTFKDIAIKAHRRVETLDKASQTARDDKLDEVKGKLDEARRLRSLSRYYAGWTDLYVATLTGKATAAQSALEQFGWILNAAENKPATLDRLPVSQFKLEHVARAAMGCALAMAAKGSTDEAIRWLDTIELADNVSKPVLDQVQLRRLGVLGEAGRWPQVEGFLTRRKTGNTETDRLSPAAARMLIVQAQEFRAKNLGGDTVLASAARVGAGAMADLVAKGELGQVLDLAKRYGVDILGGEGFVAWYVKGVTSYESARDAHKAAASAAGSKESAEEPAVDAQLIAKYHVAGDLLGKSTVVEGASTFGEAYARARVLEGLCLYYEGSLTTAATKFKAVADSDVPAAMKQDALWYAVLSLERASDRSKDAKVTEERDRVSIVYITTYPASENAARLLLRRSGSGLLTEAKAAQVLLDVPAGSPLYSAARRQAARLLYTAYRRASGPDRDFAATRYLSIAEEVMDAELERSVADVSKEAAKESAKVVLLYARQIADVALSSTTPDLSMAERALANLERVALLHGMDLGDVKAEIAYRRLQAAIIKGDQAGADAIIASMGGEKGEFAKAARRLVFKRAADAWAGFAKLEKSAAGIAAARRVVDLGNVVLAGMREEGLKPADPVRAAAAEAVAQAAATLAMWEGDAAMRELALSLDKEMVAAGVKTAAGLTRTAELSEAAGDTKTAIAAWNELSVSLPVNTADWAKARYNALRLLAANDPKAAVEALDQHEALYPSWGPEPWGAKLRELRDGLKKGGGG